MAKYRKDMNGIIDKHSQSDGKRTNTHVESGTCCISVESLHGKLASRVVRYGFCDSNESDRKRKQHVAEIDNDAEHSQDTEVSISHTSKREAAECEDG